MAKYQYLNLRERGEALYRAGNDIGAEIIKLCDEAYDNRGGWEALAEVVEDLGLPEDKGVTETLEAINEIRDQAKGLEARAIVAERALAAVQAENGRLVAVMAARGIVPPPPPPVTRPYVPPAHAKPLGPHRSYTDDDIPF